MNVNLSDLIYGATDQELNMIRAMASKHLTWRRKHKEDIAKVRQTKKCKCGANISPDNPMINRGYVYGIECAKCR